MLKARDRWIALIVAIAGFAFCIHQLLDFVGRIRNNGLAWNEGSQTIRDHYLAVGQSYSQGFATGFFLCFSILVISLAAGVRLQRRPRSGPAVAANLIADPGPAAQ